MTFAAHLHPFSLLLAVPVRQLNRAALLYKRRRAALASAFRKSQAPAQIGRPLAMASPARPPLTPVGSALAGAIGAVFANA
jgi:hypothetical protein